MNLIGSDDSQEFECVCMPPSDASLYAWRPARVCPLPSVPVAERNLCRVWQVPNQQFVLGWQQAKDPIPFNSFFDETDLCQVATTWQDFVDGFEALMRTGDRVASQLCLGNTPATSPGAPPMHAAGQRAAPSACNCQGQQPEARAASTPPHCPRTAGCDGGTPGAVFSTTFYSFCSDHLGDYNRVLNVTGAAECCALCALDPACIAYSHCAATGGCEKHWPGDLADAGTCHLYSAESVAAVKGAVACEGELASAGLPAQLCTCQRDGWVSGRKG